MFRGKWYIGLIGIFILFNQCSSPKPVLKDRLLPLLTNQVDTLIQQLDSLADAKNPEELKSRFSEARKQYKSLEPIVEFYFQGFARRINGPALPELEVDEHQIQEPTGFQMVEELIYEDTIDYSEVQRLTQTLQTDFRFVKNQLSDLPLADRHIYEAIQHQIIRVAVLGLAGFDSPIAQKGIEESRFTLQALQVWYAQVQDVRQVSYQKEVWHDAIYYVSQHTNFDEFDRVTFIREYLMPLSEVIASECLSEVKEVEKFNAQSLLQGHLADLMQGKRLYPDAFASFSEAKSTPAKVRLGKQLFEDVSLSKNNDVSCATCHQPGRAFTDGLKVSERAVHGKGFARNTPTLYYAAFQDAFFYDMRSGDLENQIGQVMSNPSEFNLSPEEWMKKWKNRTDLRESFRGAYPNQKEIGSFEVRNALASYIRSLAPFTSRVDAYFQGKGDLTVEEKQGFNLFLGKAKCGTCHFAPLYNGTIPPAYRVTESEVIGVPASVKWVKAVLDPDEGRYGVYQLEELRYAFKTPTVRNAAQTAPYMHNGVYNNLAEVIRFYNVGGGQGIGVALPHQTLPADPLHLTKKEENALIRFIEALSDQSMDK